MKQEIELKSVRITMIIEAAEISKLTPLPLTRSELELTRWELIKIFGNNAEIDMIYRENNASGKENSDSMG